MSNTPTRNFSLTPELEFYIRDRVKSGHYSNASEVVRAGLRLLIERDQAPTKNRPAVEIKPAVETKKVRR